MSCSHCTDNVDRSTSTSISQHPAKDNKAGIGTGIELDRTFYMRPLPEVLIDFKSTRGKQLFQDAVLAGTMESYFPLAQQFLTQNEPAYCGPATLAMVLNALNIDPQRVWKYPWRWFTEEMLSTCDIRKPIDQPLHGVITEGMSFEEFILLGEW